MIIDWQHHFSPEEIFKWRGGKSDQPVVQNGKVSSHLHEEIYQIDKHIEFMDRAGIDIAVLSATLESVKFCQITDDLYANIMKQYAKRFICLAPCIPTRIPDALNELDRAINDLGLKGVVISPQNDGVPLDSEKLWPFYEKVSRLNIPIFVHITNFPEGFNAFDAPYNLNVAVTREFDVALNTVRLILGGILIKFPDLKFVISHMGGGISSIFERIERYVGSWKEKFWTEVGGTPPFGEPYKENFRKLFDKLYFDMAGLEGGMNGVKCALTTIDPDRLVLGTDYPYNFTADPDGVKHYIENIKKLKLPTRTIKGILGENAAKLLHI